MKRAADLTAAQLADIVEGLRAMLYRDVDDGGTDYWNPDMAVNGGDLVQWACEEMSRHGLVPMEHEEG